MNNKYDFVFLIQATNCNPNGDPDMDNMPRIDEETMHGFMTDVCIKRNIRDYIETAFENVAGMDIMYKDGTNVNESIAKAALKANDGMIGNKNSKVRETSEELSKQYFDVRTFGAVASTGVNGGQIRGAVQIGFGQSLDPICIKDITITRNCYTEGKFTDLEKYRELDESIPEDKKRTMGRKQFVPYGLYVVYGNVSAMLAQKTGFSENDLQCLFEAIMNMYNVSSSASKTGMTVLSPMIIFKHVGTDNGSEDARKREAMLGCAPTYRLHELIEIKKKDGIEYPRTYKDYDICINKSGLPKGVEIGFKYSPLEPIVWGEPSDEWLQVR